MRRQGFGDTSIDEVIREAGLCGKGHFYHYFKSKEELGYAVLKLQFERFRRAGSGGASRADGRADRATRALHRRRDLLAVCRTGAPRELPCGALATEMASQHEGFRQLVDALFQRWADQIEAVLWEARPRLSEDADTARLAQFVVATLEGAWFMSRVKGVQASAAWHCDGAQAVGALVLARARARSVEVGAIQ